MPSPKPMYRTGTFSWSLMPITTPPLAVPSSLVMAKEVICVTDANCLACSNAFCPVLPSSTNMTSSGASGNTFFITSFIFLSSFIKPTLLCRRPAVSMITTSAPFALALWSVSNATLAGSEPICCLMTGTPTRSPQICICSTAAARKVSAAPRYTFLPAFLN